MEAQEIKVQKILESDLLIDQDYPSDPILQKCYVCEESQTTGMKWHKGLGLDTLVTHYEDHAHLAYFLKNRERIQSIQDPIAQSRYLPWHKNYSSYHMEGKIQPYLHSKYKRVRDRVKKINKAMAGISSDSGTDDSSLSSEEEESSSNDFSKPSSADDQDDNLGYAPSEIQSKTQSKTQFPDDEISLFKSNFLETDDEKHKRMIRNPPNPCKEGGKFCTKFQTREQALYHYHLYHSKVYRGHNCSKDKSCGRKFHDERDARDHDCNANVLEYISPKKKGPFIEEQRAMRSRNESGNTPGTSSLKRRPSPSIKKKHEKKNKKKKKQRRIHIISESEDDCDDDNELTSLINKAEKKRKDDPNKRKPSSSSVQQPTEGPSSKPKNDVTEQIDLTKLDLNLENLSDTGDFGHLIAGNISTKDIREEDYRFCPICSKDKIPLDKLREHVKTCLTNSSKIYNTFISMRG